MGEYSVISCQSCRFADAKPRNRSIEAWLPVLCVHIHLQTSSLQSAEITSVNRSPQNDSRTIGRSLSRNWTSSRCTTPQLRKSHSSVTYSLSHSNPNSFLTKSQEIVSCSSYSANFRPENIIDDKPKDQSSRWSGLSGSKGGNAEGNGMKGAVRSGVGLGSGSIGGGDEPWVLLKLSGPSILSKRR